MGHDSGMNEIDQTIASLRKSLRNVRKELNRTEAGRSRRSLQKKFNELSFGMAGFLLDAGRNKEAYTIHDSHSWRARNEMAYFGMTRALIELNHFERALVMLEKGLAKYPESASLWQNLGNLHHRRRDHAQALKCFEKAWQLLPNHPAILMSQGNALYGMGLYEEADRIFQNLSAEYPEDPHHVIMLGYCKLNTGYPEDAAAYFRQLIGTGHETPDIYNGLYWAYCDTGLEADALDLIQEGIRKYPSADPQLYVDVGYAYCCRGWNDEARDILIKGLEIFPEDEGIKDALGQMDDMNDPGGEPRSPGQGLVLLMLLLRKGRMHR